METHATALKDIQRFVWIPVFSALIAVSALFPIPIGPVPISMQTFFVLLAGLLLGPRAAGAAVLLYIGAGCLGLPVFSGGKGGIAVLWGPTGGYLWGFALSAVIAGCVRKTTSFFLCLLGCVLATLSVYALGCFQLSLVLGTTFFAAFAVGGAPFIPLDILKCLAAVGIHWFLRKHRLGPA